MSDPKTPASPASKPEADEIDEFEDRVTDPGFANPAAPPDEEVDDSAATIIIKNPETEQGPAPTGPKP